MRYIARTRGKTWRYGAFAKLDAAIAFVRAEGAGWVEVEDIRVYILVPR